MASRTGPNRVETLLVASVLASAQHLTRLAQISAPARLPCFVSFLAAGLGHHALRGAVRITRSTHAQPHWRYTRDVQLCHPRSCVRKSAWCSLHSCGSPSCPSTSTGKRHVGIEHVCPVRVAQPTVTREEPREASIKIRTSSMFDAPQGRFSTDHVGHCTSVRIEPTATADVPMIGTSDVLLVATGLRIESDRAW